MMQGIVELDIHGMNRYQAKTFIDSRLKSCDRSVYCLRIIHGYHGGSELSDMVRSVYRHHPKVIRISLGLNRGATDLILRELI
ncbi:MAG: Smr/MutS family protein [Clostridia bacterium]|nr:Smr/MutS family protein [Clostridia bacterium]